MLHITGEDDLPMDSFYKYHHNLMESLERVTFSLRVLDDHMIYLSILAILLLCYFVMIPFMHWLIALQSVRFLSYLFSSLFVLIVVLFINIWMQQGDLFFMTIGRITFHCLSLFGLFVFIYSTVKNIVKYKN